MSRSLGLGAVLVSVMIASSGSRSGASVDRIVATNVFYDFSLHGYSRANFVHDPVDWAVVVQLDQTGLWRVCYGEDPSLSDAEVRRRLPERFKRLLPGAPGPDQYRVDHLNPYRVHQRCAPEFRRGRVILAGDEHTRPIQWAASDCPAECWMQNTLLKH